MADYSFTAVIEPDEEAFHAHVPALPGCHTFGATLEEAQARLIEAVQLYLEGLQEEGLAIPADRGAPILTIVSVKLSA